MFLIKAKKLLEVQYIIKAEDEEYKIKKKSKAKIYNLFFSD